MASVSPDEYERIRSGEHSADGAVPLHLTGSISAEEDNDDAA